MTPRAPGRHALLFVATTVLTLAVALSLLTVVFTIFNAYVLRPFAVRDPGALHRIVWLAHDDGGSQFRWRDYEALRERRDLFEAAVAELAAGKVDKKRVQAIKDNLRYGLLMSLETPNQVAQNLSYYAGVLGSPDALDTLYQNISKVRPEDLPAFAKKHLGNANRTVLTLTPKAGGSK